MTKSFYNISWPLTRTLIKLPFVFDNTDKDAKSTTNNVKHQSIEVCSLSFIFIEAEEKIKDQKLDASASRFLETFKKEMKEGMKNISAKAQNKQGGNVQNTKNAPNSENRSSSSQNSAPQQTQSNTPKTSQYQKTQSRQQQSGSRRGR